MNTLVIYDSNFGNTKSIAVEIARNLGDHTRTISVKNFGKSDLVGTELVVWGSPINGWRPTEATMAVLNSLAENSFDAIKFTTFDTRVKLFIHGDAKDHMAEKIRSLGGTQIVPPLEFYVKGKDGPLFEGEIEKADEWARLILSKV